jgi:hypothetical protein
MVDARFPPLIVMPRGVDFTLTEDGFAHLANYIEDCLKDGKPIILDAPFDLYQCIDGRWEKIGESPHPIPSRPAVAPRLMVPGEK